MENEAAAYFRKGTEVEVSNDEDGFRGSWYLATIIKPPPSTPPPTTPQHKKSKITQTPIKATIEYKTIMANESGTKPLRESMDIILLRPIPPRETHRKFEFSEEVDAYYNEGWWEGVVTAVLKNSRYSVYFRGTKEQLDFDECDLRLHREWVHGNWVPPLGNEKVSNDEATVKTGKDVVKEKFNKGTVVEVCSDEEGFQGAWFSATILKSTGKGKYMIEYNSLKTDDDTELLKEEADVLHIRPCPPETVMVDRFIKLEEVDALYNDGWWVGIIYRVLKNSRYLVYFRGTNEELEFDHSDLRLHQDWIDGRWVVPSQALKKLHSQ